MKWSFNGLYILSAPHTILDNDKIICRNCEKDHLCFFFMISIIEWIQIIFVHEWVEIVFIQYWKNTITRIQSQENTLAKMPILMAPAFVTHTNTPTHTHTHIYIYMCVCVCVCIWKWKFIKHTNADLRTLQSPHDTQEYI